MNRPLWERVWGNAPMWSWFLAWFAQIAIALPFWLHPTQAPFYDVHGDLYRGWPLIYGLDQGDVIGDDWGPFIAYFSPGRFALNTIVAVACGLPVTGLIVWIGRWIQGSPANGEANMVRAAWEAESGAKPDPAVTRFPWDYFVATLWPAGLFGVAFALGHYAVRLAIGCMQASGPVGVIVFGWGVVRLWRGDAARFPSLRWLVWLPAVIGIAGFVLGG